MLLSRRASAGRRPKDIAGTDVINLTERAHNFARLYFRPRNPTQWNVEGVRKPEELYGGDPNTHAPVLVVFVFDARKILCRDGVYFSNGNMQSASSLLGDNDEFFRSIDFSKVYHVGGISGDRSIITARCAEILIPNRLILDECLSHVLCRSQAERLMLISGLGSDAGRWASRIHVSSDTSVFEKKYAYVESILLRRDGVVFQLKPRSDLKMVKVALRIVDMEDSHEFTAGPAIIPAVPASGRAYKVDFDLPAQSYRVTLSLEDCTAFEAVLYRSEGPL
jgi:hypothetical protein